MKQKLTICFSLLMILNGIAIAQTSSLKQWSPEQCLKLKNITAVRVSPDGKKVLYTVREAVMTDDRSEYVNQVFLCDANGSNTIQLTRNEKNSGNPRWSPDGNWISFTSARDGKNNIYILSPTGGEAQKLTDAKTSVGDYDWSPDGKMIAFVSGDASSDKEEKNKKAKDDWYYMDEEYKQNRIYIVQVNEKDSSGKNKWRKITEGNYNINSFDWSPDSKAIAYSHGISPLVGHNVYSDISMVDITTAKAKTILSTGASESDPQFSPDGKYIAYLLSEDPVVWAGMDRATIYSISDGKSWSLALTPNENGGMIGWTADGKNILWGEADRTLYAVYKLNIDGKTIQRWNKPDGDMIGGINLNATGTHAGFVLQNPSKPGEAFVSSVENFAPAKVTDINAAWANKQLPKTELIKWKSFDGTEIEGLLTYPINYQAGQKVPLILNVHGGPAGVFSQTCVAGNQGSYPIAAFAEMGFAVLRPNPRGSTGYGTKFRLANQRDWGGADYKDLMAGVDHVLKMGLADANKLGVMGWSYGGFMSSWIVGHTDRFKAASIGAPVVDLVSQDLTADIPGFLTSYMKSEPWTDFDTYNKWSPMRYVQNVKTPVLLQHGEADIRVPFSQGVMFFNALKRRNVPVRFLVLPRQPHGPTEPKMVMAAMKSNLEWFDKYIGSAEKKSF